MAEATFAIPGQLDSPTGGYGYDRRLLGLLPTLGVNAQHLELPHSFPDPTDDDIAITKAALDKIPADHTLLIDGLAFGALPIDIVSKIKQRIIPLVHHPLALETGISDARRNELAENEKQALTFADKTIVTSATTARLLASDYNVDPQTILVAEPGTDPAHRATGTGTPMQLLCVGAISPRKGYDILIKALRPLADRDWRLTIAGATDRDPDATRNLEHAIADAGFTDRVQLAGVVVPATLNRFYDSADLLIMPSLFEGYGMVLAEGMARGLPIVCTTGGAAADTVPDDAAIKVPPGDPDALTQAIDTALADRKLRARLADAAWEAGRRLPTWNETARRVAAAILDLKT